MSKKTIIVLAVFALVLLGVGLFFFRKKEEFPYFVRITK